MESALSKYRTLTGIPLAEAFASLDNELPPAAYKKITGGRAGAIGLTDINPGFLPSVLLGVFGPLGTGWGFRIESLESKWVDKAWVSSARVTVWYRYVDGAGLESISDVYGIPGGSDNSEREWAEKGAVTNALGTAWFFLGYQVSVYQGTRSHESVGRAVVVDKAKVEALKEAAKEPAPKAPPSATAGAKASQGSASATATSTDGPASPADVMVFKAKLLGKTPDEVSAEATRILGRPIKTLREIKASEVSKMRAGLGIK